MNVWNKIWPTCCTWWIKFAIINTTNYHHHQRRRRHHRCRRHNIFTMSFGEFPKHHCERQRKQQQILTTTTAATVTLCKTRIRHKLIVYGRVCCNRRRNVWEEHTIILSFKPRKNNQKNKGMNEGMNKRTNCKVVDPRTKKVLIFRI